MGPFPESQVLEKFKSGEIDSTAFVYTDGMPDWAVIKDVPVLAAQIQPSSAPKVKPQTQSGVSLPPAGHTDIKGEPTAIGGGFANPSTTKSQSVQSSKISKSPFPGTNSNVSQAGLQSPNSSISTPLPAPAASASASATQVDIAKKPRFNFKVDKKVIVAASVLIVMIGVGVNLPALLGPATEPEFEGSETPSQPLVTQSPPAPAGASAVQKANPESPAPVPAVSSGEMKIDWPTLVQFRDSKDPKNAPYRLWDKPFGGERPLILGVLNSQIASPWVSVAVFPDNTRSLMAIPQIWYLRAAVTDGFFVIGPLSHKGAGLTAGRYKVLVQVDDKFLGETGFEFGTWPDVATLNEMQKKFQDERQTMANEERTQFEARLKEANSAFEQLRTRGVSATKGKKGAREWGSFSRAWISALRKSMADHQAILRGPMFFGETQQELFGFYNQLKFLFESYQIVSEKGPKGLLKLRKKDLGKQIAEVTKVQNKLQEKANALASITPKPFELDAVSVKIGLKNFAAQAGSR